MPKSMLEILEETIEHYRTNPRAVTKHGGCVYLREDGVKCIAGRCIDPTKLPKGVQLGRLEGDIAELEDIEDFEAILYDEYQGHPVKFWVWLQALHDDSDMWVDIGNGNRLTPEGTKEVQQIIDWIENEETQ